jgi:hypothetical protein
MADWFLDPVGGDNYLVVLAVALGLLGLLALGPPRGRTTLRRRAALLAIRAAVVLMVLLAMLRPTLVYTEMRKQAATLVMLFDKSRSMTVPDAIGGKTRYEVLQRTVADSESALAALAKDYEVKAYSFDSQLHPLEVEGGRIALPEVPDGDQTAIGSDLQDVLAQEAGKRLLGVVLATDGAQQTRAPRDVPAQTAAARLKGLGFPLFAVPFGQPRGLGQAQDVRMVDLRANPTVFAKNELAVAGDVQIDGYFDREIAVKLLFETSPGKMEEVARQKIKAAAGGQRVPIRLTYVPESPGEYKLTLQAEEQPGELVTTNNELSTFVHVLKGGLNVLYLEGDLRVESKFLTRALEASPDIKVDYYRIQRNPAAAPGADPNKAFLRPSKLDLAEALKPGKYEVFILGDLDSTAFTPQELGRLADLVSKGSGLIMLGGFHSFGPGGYGQTPLADVLPAKMDRYQRQQFGDKIREDVHLRGPLRMTPSPVGLIHYALSLAAGREANLAAWAQLPPLEGANKLGQLSPGALTLATDGRENPLLVSYYYGTGRVMALAADSTWRWWMRGFENPHKRFWRQIVLWLARKDEASEGSVWVKLQPRRYAPGERVEFTAGANDPTGEPVKDAKLTAEVVLSDGRRVPVALVSGEAGLTGTFREADKPDDYAVEVTAVHQGQVLGKARARFLVYQQDLELDNPAADTSAMESLAAITGGESLAPEQLPKLLERLAQEGPSLEIEHIRKLTFWDTWPFFLVLVGLLGLEWYLRKRWGLV